MSYFGKNWLKTSEELKSVYNILSFSGKNELPPPDLLQKPFFTDSRLEMAAYQVGRENLVEIYLEQLNAPLRTAGLFPYFGSEMLRFSTLQGGMVHFDGVQEVLDTGTDIKMAVMPFSEFRSNYLAFQGNYAPLMYTEAAFRKSGALGVSLVKIGTPLPLGTIRGRIVLTKKDLSWLNQELKSRHLSLVPESLTTPHPESRSLSQADISIFDQNSAFYSVVNLGGETLRFSRRGDNHSEGEVFLARTPDHKTVFVEELRPLLGCRELSLVRGFPKNNRSAIIEFEEETGYVIPKEYPLSPAKIITSGLYDYSRPNLNIVKLDQQTAKPNIKNQIVISESGFESLNTIKLDDRTLVQKIINGEIWDAFTLSSMAKFWIAEKMLHLSDRASDLGIVLEYRAWASGEEGYTIPYVPADSGLKISEITPDTGTSRIIHPLKLIKTSDLPEGYQYEIKSLPEILAMISAGTLDTPTASAILVSLLHQNLLTIL